MVILGDIRRNRRLFPYLFIYRTEEDVGSNPISLASLGDRLLSARITCYAGCPAHFV
jgi:hypothetical protein